MGDRESREWDDVWEADREEDEDAGDFADIGDGVPTRLYGAPPLSITVSQPGDPIHPLVVGWYRYYEEADREQDEDDD